MEAEVERVRVVVQGGGHEAGAQEAMASEDGRPETVKATACTVPERSVAVRGMETEEPRVTDGEPTPVLRAKAKAAAPLPNS